MIGLAIPIAMILFIAIAINGPRWFSSIEPAKYDFLYTTGQQNPLRNYSVENGRLVANELPEGQRGSSGPQDPPHFFVHDVFENKSREIQLEEATGLFLDASIRSPDGFTIESARRRGWFFFRFNRDYRSRFLVKESFSEKLNLESSDGNYNYYWNFQFYGWVTDGE